MLGFASSFFNFKRCYLCGKNSLKDVLCDKCFEKLEKYKYENKYNIEHRRNFKNNNQLYDDNLIEFEFIFRYEKYVRKLILEYKFFDKSYLGKVFTEFIIRQKNLYKKLKSYDIIIPVPMYKYKKRIRGYNQTEIITKNICYNLKNIVHGNKILVKIKDTKKQSLLNRTERLYNVSGAYKIQEKYLDYLENKQVIILDDIYTTGATIRECIEVLKKAKVKKILVLILAKD